APSRRCGSSACGCGPRASNDSSSLPRSGAAGPSPPMTSLRDSIEGLYAAFAASALPRTIDCSPLIADQWAPVEAVLRRKPLRALTGEDLDVYAWRALTTSVWCVLRKPLA